MHIDGLTQCLFWMKSIDNSQVVQEVRKEDQIDRAFLQVLRTQGFELIGECHLAGVGQTFLELKLDSMRILAWRPLTADRSIVLFHQSRVFTLYPLHVKSNRK